MRKKKHHEEAHENHERWLLTYSDLITLLMIFFIVLYSMSSIDNNKYKKVIYGLNQAFGSAGGKNIVGIDGAVQVDNWQPTNTDIVEDKGKQEAEETRLQQVKEQLDKYLSQTGLSDSVVSKIEERGLVVTLKDSLLFDSGKAEIKEAQGQKLIDIGKILNRKEISDSYIRVEGHTDNVPISNYLFKSNWDLSVMRASNVAQLLIKQSGIAPQRISAMGYGEYRPITDNSTEAGRSTNRRVEIVIVNSKFNGVENNKQ